MAILYYRVNSKSFLSFLRAAIVCLLVATSFWPLSTYSQSVACSVKTDFPIGVTNQNGYSFDYQSGKGAKCRRYRLRNEPGKVLTPTVWKDQSETFLDVDLAACSAGAVCPWVSAVKISGTEPDQGETMLSYGVNKDECTDKPDAFRKRPVSELGFTPNVAELDFVSQFPSIMARFNISPETVNCPCCPDAPRIPELGYRICQKRRGITSRVVERLIAKRCELKKLLKTTPPDAAVRFKLQRDSMKWLLVCCFGYTGYKNARFGKIEAHEAINAVARETLLVAKEIAEADGFELIHALVDSLYVCKDGAAREDYERLSQKIEDRTRLPLAIESVYRYVVFLPSKQYADVPVPNRFFAVGEDGELKVRGLECRRHDTPPLLARMQHEVLAILAEAHDYDSYLEKLETARGVFANYEDRLANGEVDVRELVVSKRITREPRDYQKAGVTAIAAQQLFGSGVKLRPGQNIEYVITNAEARVPNDRVRAYALWEGWFGYDRTKYAAMLREAFEPFVLCVPKRAEPVLLSDSISENDLKRFPLFSALAISRL
jgi:hypothetical protein